jgi:4-hydroxy-tetrahydrodipicolinate synthase
MIRPYDLSGCMPALITFMRPDSAGPGGFSVDFEATAAHARDILRAGCAGVVVAGTTGQSATITHDEQIRLAAVVGEAVRDEAQRLGRRAILVVSAGSNATHEAVHLSRNILQTARPDALLHVTGYYNNPPQEGLIRHFSIVADMAAEHDAGIILYNVPTRTKSHLEVETVVELSRHPAILAIKEASGDHDYLRRIASETSRDEFALISGEDGIVDFIMSLGGVGVISASANVWPAQFQRLTELMAAGDTAKAAALQKALLPCVDATFCVKNPIPAHHMLASPLRLPLVSVSDLAPAHRAKCEAVIGRALALRDFPGCSPEQSGNLARISA